MCAGYVIPLVVYIMKKLPVVGNLTDTGFTERDHVSQAIVDDLQLFRHRLPTCLETNEHQALPNLEFKGDQALLMDIEAFECR